MFSAVDGFRTVSINVADGYISTFNSNTTIFTAIPNSSGDTLYLGGFRYDTPGENNLVWLKVNNDNGARIATQRQLGNTGLNETGFILDIDTSENVYIVGTAEDGLGNTSPVIGKYTNTGNLTWQRTLDGPLNPTRSGSYDEVAVEPNGGNIYASGTVNRFEGNMISPTGISELVKFASNGTILTQQIVTYFEDGNTSYTPFIQDLTVDSGNYLYVTGIVPQSFDGNTTYHTGGSVLKLDSSGSAQWNNGLYNTAGNVQFNVVTTDSANSVYGIGTNINTNRGLAFKIHANGVFDWKQEFANASMNGITVDNTGNVYIVGRRNPDFGDGIIMCLEDTSGNINWQTFVDNSTANILIYDIGYSNNFLYTGGYFQAGAVNGFNGFSMKLPSNGNTTGTYGSWSFTSGNLSNTTSTLSEGGDTFTFGNSNYTPTTSSFSSTNSPVARRIIPL